MTRKPTKVVNATELENKKLYEIMERLKILFHLEQWEISLEFNEITTGGNTALNFMRYNEQHSVIQIKNSESYSSKLEVVIHEMLHIVLRDTQNIPCEEFEDNPALVKYYTRWMEREHQNLTRIVQELLKEAKII